jgi:hypothetical protein
VKIGAKSSFLAMCLVHSSIIPELENKRITNTFALSAADKNGIPTGRYAVALARPDPFDAQAFQPCNCLLRHCRHPHASQRPWSADQKELENTY